jgi:uncharacterized protein involved in exopolysaccharide biosynthesis
MSDSQDNLNLSGLEYYTLRDYGAMFLRRKWFIIITTFAVAVLTAVVAYFLPNSYRATTVILVDPQKVPEYYVNPTVTTNAGDRLGTLRQQILSATRLGQVVDEMGLYKELKKKESQDEIVENMRNHRGRRCIRSCRKGHGGFYSLLRELKPGRSCSGDQPARFLVYRRQY